MRRQMIDGDWETQQVSIGREIRNKKTRVKQLEGGESLR